MGLHTKSVILGCHRSGQTSAMDKTEHLDNLERDGQLLADAAAKAGGDAAVPSCPDWKVRDLVLHIGGVHRWAGAHVVKGSPTRLDRVDDGSVVGLDHASLVAWFREGHDDLLATLRGAPDDLQCWTFLPAPSPVAFWARRQAHETAIHRVDAELGASITATAFPPQFATDGLDELLVDFLPFYGQRIASDQPQSIAIVAADVSTSWVCRTNSEGVAVERVDGEASGHDAVVTGSASDLFVHLWNRVPANVPAITGDESLVTSLLEKVRL